MSSQVSIKHLARLANLPLTSKLQKQLDQEFTQTLDYVKDVQKVDTAKVKASYHVTGLNNIFREDLLLPEQTLSQEQALKNSTQTYQGYFVVKAVFDEQ